MRRRAFRFGVVAAIAWLGAPAPLPAAEPVERVADGLEALYTFEADVAGTIPDRSGVQPPVDLRIDKPEAVRFHGAGMAVGAPVTIASDGPATRITSRLRQAQQFTLECWLEPAAPEQTGPARIVSLSLDTGKRAVTLSQDKGRYDLRLRTSATSDNGTPSTPAPDGSAATRRTHLVATRSPDGVVKLWLDGREAATNTVAGDMNRWPDDCRLVIANEVGGGRPWQGELSLVAIYSRALSPEEVGRNFRAGAPQPAEAVRVPRPHAVPVDGVATVFPMHCDDRPAADGAARGLDLGVTGRNR